jgi:adenylylsulfate reductase subunit A
MTCQEVRFVPVRFKDAYGPVGAWFLLFQSGATNALGEDYMKTRAAELEKWAPYGTAKPTPANLRNYLMMLEIQNGNHPIYMRTEEAIQQIVEKIPDETEAKRTLRNLENEAWEDFLDMTISQALLWASLNIQPEKTPSEISACEPYFISSHSGASGAWISGPADLSPPPYHWTYEQMTTVEGLFAAGDASGASSHKFSSGSFTEGRIAAKSAIRFCRDHPDQHNLDENLLELIKAEVLKPLDTFYKHRDYSVDPDVNPHFIKPQMRCWENIHRLWQAEAHIHSMLFREETRWPGYYFRTDFPDINRQWRFFVNCRFNHVTGKWEMMKKEVIDLVQ